MNVSLATFIRVSFHPPPKTDVTWAHAQQNTVFRQGDLFTIPYNNTELVLDRFSGRDIHTGRCLVHPVTHVHPHHQFALKQVEIRFVN